MTPVHTSEPLLFSVLLQLIVMIGVARLFHSLARKLGQPGVTGETIAGLILGPSLFDALFPAAAETVFGRTASAPIVVITMLVIMAVATTIMTGPLLRYLLPRMGHAPTERVSP